GMGVASANALSIGEDLWDELSDEQRRVIMEVSAEVPAKVGEFDAQFDALSCETVKEAGSELHVFSEAEVEKLKAAGADKIYEDWKKAATDAGADAEAVIEAYTAALRAAEPEYPDYKTGVASCLASQ